MQNEIKNTNNPLSSEKYLYNIVYHLAMSSTIINYNIKICYLLAIIITLEFWTNF